MQDSEVVGVQIDNVVCFIYYREYLYRQDNLMSRLNMTILREEKQLKISFDSAVYEEDGLFPPGGVLVVSSLANMGAYTDKIGNYSFMCTIVVMWCFSVLITELRQLQTNHNQS
jgi:hypothetical protein